MILNTNLKYAKRCNEKKTEIPPFIKIINHVPENSILKNAMQKTSIQS